MTPPRPAERGFALLVVMVAVAILTALSVQLAYETRVELQLAGNARDRLRAEQLARSGVALSRLVLSLQQQLDTASGAAGGQLAQLAQRTGGGAQAAAAAAGAIPSLRLWSAVPVNSGLVQALFGGKGAAPEPEAEGDAPAAARFGDFEGMFAADIEDEGSKVNAQLDALGTSGRLGPQVVGLWQLVCDPRWDPLFDREDANGTRVSRQDLVMHLRDWVDDDEATASLVASFPGAACLILAPPNPFEQGFGDEDFPYDRGDDRYKAKNARFDSLDELYLVSGVTDAFMAAFGDRLTVYVPREAKRTIDPRNGAGLLELAMGIADPPGQPILYDPEFAPLLQRAVMEQTLGGVLAMPGQQFVQLVVALGVQVSAVASNPTSPQNPLGDSSKTFRIRATGAAGDVEAKVDAVVTFEADRSQTRAVPAGQNPGRLIRWREE